MGDINKIAVLYGGSSSEREISIQSGEGVYKAIIELGYITELIDINDLEDLSELKVFDFIFIALHGFEGEGGKLQEDLDDLNILYSGSNSKACRNTWNKRLTKEILERQFGLKLNSTKQLLIMGYVYHFLTGSDLLNIYF
jgi:D-alanine-D-alanine ligase